VLDLQHDMNNIAVHSLDDLGIVDTLLVWRRGHFSSALKALRETLLASSNLAEPVGGQVEVGLPTAA
jgi:hypothetical protein